MILRQLLRPVCFGYNFCTTVMVIQNLPISTQKSGAKSTVFLAFLSGRPYGRPCGRSIYICVRTTFYKRTLRVQWPKMGFIQKSQNNNFGKCIRPKLYTRNKNIKTWNQKMGSPSRGNCVPRGEEGINPPLGGGGKHLSGTQSKGQSLSQNRIDPGILILHQILHKTPDVQQKLSKEKQMF